MAARNSTGRGSDRERKEGHSWHRAQEEGSPEVASQGFEEEKHQAEQASGRGRYGAPGPEILQAQELTLGGGEGPSSTRPQAGDHLGPPAGLGQGQVYP